MNNLSTNDQSIRVAMSHAYQGERTESRALLREAVMANPENYRAWLWLAYTAETEEEKRAALHRALCLKPDNEKVHKEFKRMLTIEHVQRAAQKGTFICYSRADELFAVELAEKIKARSLPVWIDMLDVPMNADWKESVHKALDESGLMLLILSPDMINGEDTRQELESFLKSGKIVLPLMHKTCDPAALNLMHPIIDFRDQKYTTGLRLVYALMGITKTTQTR